MPIGTISLTGTTAISAATLTLTQTSIPLASGGGALLAAAIVGLAPRNTPIELGIGYGATAETVKLVGIKDDTIDVVRGVLDNHTHAASETVFVLSDPSFLWRAITKTLTGINT